MSLAEALAADRAGDVQSAAARYEEVLSAGDRSLRVIVNLALLYWQATDPGLAAANRLDRDFLATAGLRSPELLNEACRLYPQSTVPRFWKRYIAWADLGEPLEPDECRRLLREDPTALVPAMYLFATTEGREARDDARELLRQCLEDGTAGARYIASVLESVSTHSGQHD